MTHTISHHAVVYASTRLTAKQTEKLKKQIFGFSRINTDKVGIELEQSMEKCYHGYVLGSVEGNLTLINNAFQNLLKTYAPKINLRTSSRYPWFTAKLNRFLNIKSTFSGKRKTLKTTLIGHLISYSQGSAKTTLREQKTVLVKRCLMFCVMIRKKFGR